VVLSDTAGLRSLFQRSIQSLLVGSATSIKAWVPGWRLFGLRSQNERSSLLNLQELAGVGSRWTRELPTRHR